MAQQGQRAEAASDGDAVSGAPANAAAPASSAPAGGQQLQLRQLAADQFQEKRKEVERYTYKESLEIVRFVLNVPESQRSLLKTWRGFKLKNHPPQSHQSHFTNVIAPEWTKWTERLRDEDTRAADRKKSLALFQSRAGAGGHGVDPTGLSSKTASGLGGAAGAQPAAGVASDGADEDYHYADEVAQDYDGDVECDVEMIDETFSLVHPQFVPATLASTASGSSSSSSSSGAGASSTTTTGPFLPRQRDAIECIVRGEHDVVLSGLFGKSVAYLFPVVLTGGLCVVFTSRASLPWSAKVQRIRRTDCVKYGLLMGSEGTMLESAETQAVLREIRESWEQQEQAASVGAGDDGNEDDAAANKGSNYAKAGGGGGKKRTKGGMNFQEGGATGSRQGKKTTYHQKQEPPAGEPAFSQGMEEVVARARKCISNNQARKQEEEREAAGGPRAGATGDQHPHPDAGDVDAGGQQDDQNSEDSAEVSDAEPEVRTISVVFVNPAYLKTHATRRNKVINTLRQAVAKRRGSYVVVDEAHALVQSSLCSRDDVFCTSRVKEFFGAGTRVVAVLNHMPNLRRVRQDVATQLQLANGYREFELLPSAAALKQLQMRVVLQQSNIGTAGSSTLTTTIAQQSDADKKRADLLAKVRTTEARAIVIVDDSKEVQALAKYFTTVGGFVDDKSAPVVEKLSGVSPQMPPTQLIREPTPTRGSAVAVQQAPGSSSTSCRAGAGTSAKKEQWTLAYFYSAMQKGDCDLMHRRWAYDSRCKVLIVNAFHGAGGKPTARLLSAAPVSLVVHYTASALRNLAKLAEDVAPLLYEKNEAGAWSVAAGGVENGMKQLKREHLLWYDGFAPERANSHLYTLREKLLKAPGGGSKGNKSQVQDCTKEVYDFCRQASGVHKASFLTKLGLNKLAGVSMYGGASSSSSSSFASAATGAVTCGAGQVDPEPTAEQVAKQLEKQTRDHAIANAAITGSSGAAASSFSKPLQPAQPTKKSIIQDDLLMDILKAESTRESGVENSTGNGGAEQMQKPCTARDAAIRMFGASSSTAAKKKNEKPPNSGGAAKVKKTNGKTKASAAGSVKSNATSLGGISALGGFASLLEPNKRVNSQNKPSGLQLGGKVASTNTTKARDAMPATEADQAGDRAAVAPSSKTRCESLAAAGASVVRKNSKEDFKRQLPKEVLRADSHIADKMASFMRLEEDDRREAARSRKPSQEDPLLPPAGGEGASCNKRKSHDGAGGRDGEHTARMRDETENCSDSRPPPSKKKRTLKAQNSVANTEILPDNTQRLGGTSGMKSAHKEGALGAASSGSAPATLAAAANTTSDAPSSSAPSAVPPVFGSATAGCSSSCSGGASTSSSSNLALGAQSANVDVAASGASAPSGDPGAPAAGSMKTRANSDEVVLIDDDTSDDDVFSAKAETAAAPAGAGKDSNISAKQKIGGGGGAATANNSTSSASCSAGSKADIMKQAQPQSSSKDSDPAPGSLFSSFLNDRGGNREVKKEKLKKKGAANNPPKRSPGQLQAAARVQEKSPTPARQPQGKKAGEDFFAKFAHSTAKKPQLSKES